MVLSPTDFPPLLILFFKGIIIGLAITAPIGPVAIMCIRRTLSKHKLLALVTGMGSACADVFYASVAAFSLIGISNFITTYNFYLKLFGGLLLAWLGLSILKHPPLKSPEHPKMRDSWLHAFSSAFILTLSNPITLIVFAASFTAMSVSPVYHSFIPALLLIMGVFLGAMIWWIFLIAIIYLMHHKLSDNQLIWVNRFSGVVLIGFSVYILLSLV
jgi:threonine/homoserine/homoserine lactone efflux protein